MNLRMEYDTFELWLKIKQLKCVYNYKYAFMVD